VIRPTRRQILGLGAAGIAGLGAGRAWPFPGASVRSARALTAPSRGGRLVIVGASFAGISLARAVKRLVPSVEVTLLEREPFFLFAPAQLRYLFGLVPFHEIARGYGVLTSQGMPVIRSAVVAIDRDRRRVVTTEGAVDYDYVALTSGIRLVRAT